MVNTHIGLETETMVVFGIVALFALSVDIWVHRKDKPIALKSAIMWTLFWIAVSMCFALFLYVHFNGEVANFVTAYSIGAYWARSSLDCSSWSLARPSLLWVRSWNFSLLS